MSFWSNASIRGQRGDRDPVVRLSASVTGPMPASVQQRLEQGSALVAAGPCWRPGGRPDANPWPQSPDRLRRSAERLREARGPAMRRRQQEVGDGALRTHQRPQVESPCAADPPARRRVDPGPVQLPSTPASGERTQAGHGLREGRSREAHTGEVDRRSAGESRSSLSIRRNAHRAARVAPPKTDPKDFVLVSIRPGPVRRVGRSTPRTRKDINMRTLIYSACPLDGVVDFPGGGSPFETHRSAG